MPFAIFDVETRIDKRLLNQVFYAAEGLTDDQAFERRAEEQKRRGYSDFAPTTLHVPISIAFGIAGDDHILRSVETLGADRYSEENLVREFWSRTEGFAGTLVSFNGRRFDLPVLELAALRYGISAPQYFSESGSARSRHSSERHFYLVDFLTNYGAASLAG